MRLPRDRRNARGPALAAALIGALGLGVAAREEPKPANPGVEYWAVQAARDRIATADAPGTPLTFRKEPALHWSNPVRKTADGALFLWTDRGRPEVAVSLFYYPDNRGKMTVVHEFQTLALKPLVARHDGRDAWLPGVGLVPRPIPGAPAPGAEPAERLRQMRALAREFKATFGEPPDRTELRALTQPLYRHEVAKSRQDVLDGALFGFVHTTDPEVLLLIEARPEAPGGPMAWHYALARMSGYPLRAEHKGREVWRADVVTVFGDRTAPYFSINDPAEGL
jgi:hypothetical protein